jgi:hypothetical protein
MSRHKPHNPTIRLDLQLPHSFPTPAQDPKGRRDLNLIQLVRLPGVDFPGAVPE